MTPAPSRADRFKGLQVLAAGMLLAFVMGSVHAFSVFLVPMETAFGATRGEVSLTYSLALVFLTLGVFAGYRIYSRLPEPLLAVLLCAAGALGAGIAAFASSLPMVWLGYSLIFGGANGLGYGYALQISAQANPRHKGIAMGVITACYAVSAAPFSLGYDWALAWGGIPAAMGLLALALLAIAPVAALLLSRSKTRFAVAEAATREGEVAAPRLTLILWIGYGTGVAAGLMAIGHATGIAAVAGLSDSLVLAAPAVIAISGIPGSLAGGWLVDRFAAKGILIALPLASAAALAGLAIAETASGVVMGLAATGFTYGALIVVYPAAVTLFFGPVAGVHAYGRVFTAWGTAGLLAPWFAGLLFDWRGDYGLSLAAAGGLALASAAAAAGLPKSRA